MSKKIVGAMLVVFLVLVFAGAVYATPSEPEPEVPLDTFDTNFGFGTSSPAVPAPFSTIIQPDWPHFTGFDRHFVSLVPGTSTIVNLTVPKEFGSYRVRYVSLDPSVATVVANSPARITAKGVGTTWVVAVVETDTKTYYDTVKVEVVSQQIAAARASGTTLVGPVATPSTAGGFGISVVGLLTLAAALPLLWRKD